MDAHIKFPKNRKNQIFNTLYDVDMRPNPVYNMPMNYPATTATLNPDNPAEIGTYPPTLPIEIALRTAPLPEICAAYSISHEEWLVLRNDPVFQRDLTAAVELVKKDGMSFKLKAQLQADELLKTSWKMIHSNNEEVPASVRADLLKFTVRAAGLADPAEKGGGGPQNALQININLS